MLCQWLSSFQCRAHEKSLMFVEKFSSIFWRERPARAVSLAREENETKSNARGVAIALQLLNAYLVSFFSNVNRSKLCKLQ